MCLGVLLWCSSVCVVVGVVWCCLGEEVAYVVVGVLVGLVCVVCGDCCLGESV